jgi:hypothetical protein
MSHTQLYALSILYVFLLTPELVLQVRSLLSIIPKSKIVEVQFFMTHLSVETHLVQLIKYTVEK